jgi:hypothetical protein
MIQDVPRFRRLWLFQYYKDSNIRAESQEAHVAMSHDPDVFGALEIDKEDHRKD